MKSLFLIILLAPLLLIAQQKEKLNVVFILADDLGYMDLGCYGSAFYETTNIDALAKDAMRFTNAYAAAAVCSPTRASILTGKYPINTGITDYIHPKGGDDPKNWKRNTPLLPALNKDHLALEEVTIAETLKQNGYKTFIAGKWHLGGEIYTPEAQGFDINIGAYEAGHPKSYFSPYKNPKLKDGAVGEYLPERLAKETAQFISQHKKQPFFAYHALYLPHTPLSGKDSLIAKYQRKAERLGLSAEFGTEGKSKIRLNQTLAVYAAMVEALDNAVGTIVKSLKENNLYDNTVIIFTSDNGGLSTTEGSPTSNTPLRGGKGWLYQGGIKEPLIVRIPNITKPGMVSDALVTSPDFYPTILETLKIPLKPSQHTDGVSFLGAIEGKNQKTRDLYWHYPQYGNQGGSPSSAIISKNWKLIKFYGREENQYELYNIKKDVSEKQDLSKTKRSKTKDLAEKLQSFLDKNNALYPTKNNNYRQ